jgi:hypothetical protein
MRMLLTLFLVCLSALPAWAGEADVLAVEAVREAGGTWRFDVTVRHADEGWAHYADRWDVLLPDGAALATRTLLHPHDNEQPFTRSLTRVAIPPDVAEVEVRARDSVHGYGGATFKVELKR